MFTTTAKVRHVTPIPPGIPASKGILLLQGHEFFIKCDPHMIKYEPSPLTDKDDTPSVPTDRGIEPVSGSRPKCYVVTDRVQTLPAGLWDSDVVSRYEFVNIEKGVFVRIRSPLGIVMESVWEVREGEGEAGDGLELVEDILITCSRFLIGTVKSTCESGWQGIHDKIIAYLEKEERGS